MLAPLIIKELGVRLAVPPQLLPTVPVTKAAPGVGANDIVAPLATAASLLVMSSVNTDGAFRPTTGGVKVGVRDKGGGLPPVPLNPTLTDAAGPLCGILSTPVTLPSVDGVKTILKKQVLDAASVTPHVPPGARLNGAEILVVPKVIAKMLLGLVTLIACAAEAVATT